MKRSLALAFIALVSVKAFAQSSDHVNAVRHAQRSAYAVTDATNSCPTVGADILGWPGSLVRKCVYVEGVKPRQMTGVVFLVDVKPEIVARWIETTCSSELRNTSGCFNTVLKCGQENSGMMFPISGDVMENMDPKTWKNYFFPKRDDRGF